MSNKMTECKYRCKDCNHNFSVKVHGSDANCPKKGDYLRNCPKCESRNVTMTGGSTNTIICFIVAAIICVIVFLIFGAEGLATFFKYFGNF